MQIITTQLFKKEKAITFNGNDGNQSPSPVKVRLVSMLRGVAITSLHVHR
jgi:hypothetical protein